MNKSELIEAIAKAADISKAAAERALDGTVAAITTSLKSDLFTLRGEVLGIGGLKEKLLAAHRGGIKSVLIPEENSKDLVEIPDNIKNRLDIHPVKWIDQVLEFALERQPVPLKDDASGAVAIPAIEPTAVPTSPIKH